MPVAFVSHGAPLVALERGPYQTALAEWGRSLLRPAQRPRAVVAVSAHWETDLPVEITCTGRNSLIYDFSGFPDPLYELRYPAAGSLEVAERVEHLLRTGGDGAGEGHRCQRVTRRGLDHGVWIPLRLIFPGADVPVVQVSLPRVPPAELYAVGRTLSQLPEESILLLASGGIVHNLARIYFEDRAHAPDAWASEFDGWVWEQVRSRNHQALLDYRRGSAAEAANLAVPPHSPEHFLPLCVALGAAGAEREAHGFFEGFDFGNLSMRCIQWR